MAIRHIRVPQLSEVYSQVGGSYYKKGESVLLGEETYIEGLFELSEESYREIYTTIATARNYLLYLTNLTINKETYVVLDVTIEYKDNQYEQSTRDNARYYNVHLLVGWEQGGNERSYYVVTLVGRLHTLLDLYNARIWETSNGKVIDFLNQEINNFTVKKLSIVDEKVKNTLTTHIRLLGNFKEDYSYCMYEQEYFEVIYGGVHYEQEDITDESNIQGGGWLEDIL